MEAEDQEFGDGGGGGGKASEKRRWKQTREKRTKARDLFRSFGERGKAGGFRRK